MESPVCVQALRSLSSAFSILRLYSWVNLGQVSIKGYSSEPSLHVLRESNEISNVKYFVKSEVLSNR